MGPVSVTEHVARRVRQLRVERGWSAQQLADECASAGFDSPARGTIAKIESGVRKSITVDELYALAKAFGLSPSELLAVPALSEPSPALPEPGPIAPRSELTFARLPEAPALDDKLLDLRDRLSSIALSRLRSPMRQALGPGIPLPRPEDVHDAWDAFNYLSDFNAGPDGIPPSVMFLRLLAEEVGGDVGIMISNWVSDQASRLRLGPALDKPWLRQPLIPDQPHLFLTIMIEPDSIDPERCVLTYWRQDDPALWPPPLTGVREVILDELEYRVDEVILEAEGVWAGQSISAALEFLLPRTLLHLPVQLWSKEHESGQPRPLRYDYRLSIRSLERMRIKHWHRVWHMRWDSMLENPSADRLHYSGSAEPEGHPIDGVLSDSRWVGLVMTKPPSPHPEPGTGPDEFTAALRGGLPVIFWHPDAGPEDLREPIDWLLGGDSGFMDLPARRKLANVPAALPFDNSLIRDLVVMWDDPKRVIVLDQLAP